MMDTILSLGSSPTPPPRAWPAATEADSCLPSDAYRRLINMFRRRS